MSVATIYITLFGFFIQNTARSLLFLSAIFASTVNAMECDGRWYDLKMVRSQCVLGSITSRCSGKEPALLP